ncbi:MAG: pilus assembly protein, partial [Eggerthellaceae bacterium]|nr:pilus assembly protein [Eggerthellaceae bacterium]
MSWRTRRCDRGQATVEAAFAIPVLFVLLLMLVQPGIVLYDRIIMRHAAAEGCRLLATRSVSSGMTDEKCIQIVKRQ